MFLYYEPYKIDNFEVTEYVLFCLFVISIVLVMSIHMNKRNKTNYSAIFDSDVFSDGNNRHLQ